MLEYFARFGTKMKIETKLFFKSGAFVVAILTVLWLSFIGASIWNFGKTIENPSAEFAIVLGAAVYNDAPSPVFKERINYAISLYKSGKVKKLIFTGGFGKGAKFSESEVAAKLAASQGIAPKDILIEEKSRTTHQNLLEAKEILDAENFKSTVLISDPLHLYRATKMANDLGIDALPAPTPTTKYKTLKSKVPFLLREIYFIHHYYLTGD